MRVVTVLLFFIVTSVAHAQWTGPQETEFLESYNKSCAVNPADAKLCKLRCECMMTELKRAYPNYAAADEAAWRQDAATLKTVAEAQQVCRKLQLQ